MKTFHCSNCQQLVFFENTVCLHCGHTLAYLPDRVQMCALRQHEDGQWWPEGAAAASAYRLCSNYSERNVCNWAVPASDPQALCQSCRLTQVIPDLTASGWVAWARLESAKRRLICSLLQLQLPLLSKAQDADAGVAFEFLKDSSAPNGDQQRVLTGHDNGLITINIDEADDVQRERQRQQQGEPYRTLLGHFRHEIGHYYWDRLIADGPGLREFRRLFGDETADYASALKRHYQQGAPPDWQEHYISAYASSHPWEDWAETWAHFLHIYDALETAGHSGLALRPSAAREPSLSAPGAASPMSDGFDRMIERWVALTYVLNNLNRGLGLPDGYPFVLTGPVIDKLRSVFETISALASGAQRRRGSSLRAIASSTLIGAAAAVVAAGVAHALWSSYRPRLRS